MSTEIKPLRRIRALGRSGLAGLVLLAAPVAPSPPAAAFADCNGNGIADPIDIGHGVSADCNADGIPDECQPDCNANLQADDCDIATGASMDCNADGIPDECQPDCNANLQADDCDIATGASLDCDADAIPDECRTTPNFSTHAITDQAANAHRAELANLDGDGDLDVLAAYDDLAWTENLGAGAFGPLRIISTDFTYSASAADIDGDGDLDAVHSAYRRVAWFENLDGTANFGPARVVLDVGESSQYRFPYGLAVGDLNEDGMPDILVGFAGGYDGSVAWFENLGGSRNFGPMQVIGPAVTHNDVWTVAASDLDGDGDLDAISAANELVSPGNSDGVIAWYRNLDGQGSFGPKLTVTDQLFQGRVIRPIDLDGDWDLDLLICCSSAWYRNVDGAGSFVEAQTLDGVPKAGADLDSDGDVDLFSDGDPVSWLENTDGHGMFGAGQPVAGVDIGSYAIDLGDIDGNGRIDALLGDFAYGIDENPDYFWFENLHQDCNRNGTPDACDIAAGNSVDCDADGMPDECAPDCNGNGVADACEIVCATDCDADGDACFDELDPQPSNATACGDVDADGCDDCAGGAFAPRVDGPDPDWDGVCDASDCLANDPTLWWPPGPSSGLSLSRVGSEASLTWAAPEAPGADAVRYDVLRSTVAADFETPAVCLESDEPGSTAADAAVPVEGGVFFYLVRAENDCPQSTGAMGSGSNGVPRVGRACP